MVRVAGFGEFVSVLTRASNDRQVVRALADRWWDTTNSFHFSFGEMMVTPLDFAAITDLRVEGDPIPYDATAGRDPKLQRRLLGYKLRAKKGDTPYPQLLEFWTEPLESRVQEEQMARCFLVYVLGVSLFPNRRNRVHLSFLQALRNIEEIAHFDWGGTALGACYAFMGSLSQEAGKSLGGYWRLWTYEVLVMYPPMTSCPNDTILPRALHWSKEYRGVKKGKGDLNAYRAVHWHIWDRFEVPYVAQSRVVARGRVLLESPYDWEWYLGDRVSHQLLRLDVFRVLGPLPPFIQRTSEYTLEEVERFTQPDLQLEPLFQAGTDYAEYQAQYMMQGFKIRAAWEAQGGRGGRRGRRGRR
ncbi:protein MAINTENANCE OF MERISTEMS-like [Rhododendron vialii]|uniref:protein MAINTENANCE OF MERISTEMS-like n=1 Tax=Rhododendron vialii TaxID=182163 RepID=UPI00265F379C|nr:protein MAINTENANCE OF MERISTEMS-like [Rhododendron vialii]